MKRGGGLEVGCSVVGDSGDGGKMTGLWWGVDD